jgi:hypothetical protein
MILIINKCSVGFAGKDVNMNRILLNKEAE